VLVVVDPWLVVTSSHLCEKFMFETSKSKKKFQVVGERENSKG
jgi:hypothetical protein